MSFAVLSDQWRSRLTLQHAVATVSLGEQNADAGDEGLAEIAAAPVRQNASQSSGTRQVVDPPITNDVLYQLSYSGLVAGS